MLLEPDIVERIKADFVESDAALDMLRASGKTGRIARCIVLAAQGSLQKMEDYIALSKLDFRDVVMNGEYDEHANRIRDLNVSFLIASAADFWISSTASSLYKRGYLLKSVESQPATVGPFDYGEDDNEGTATFSNGFEQMVVQKRDRIWSVVSPSDDLRRYHLDEPFEDAERFRIQLDCYLADR